MRFPPGQKYDACTIVLPTAIISDLIFLQSSHLNRRGDVQFRPSRSTPCALPLVAKYSCTIPYALQFLYIPLCDPQLGHGGIFMRLPPIDCVMGNVGGWLNVISYGTMHTRELLLGACCNRHGGNDLPESRNARMIVF